MQLWIVSNSEPTTARVLNTLSDLDFDCPLEHVLGLSTVLADSFSWDMGEGVVFVTADEVSGDLIGLVSEIRSSSSNSIVVVAPASDSRRMLQAIRAGADDFLDVESDLRREIGDLVTRVFYEQRRSVGRGRLVSVFPAYSQGDCDLTAVNLAAASARGGRSCALLDLNLSGGDLATYLGVSPQHTVNDLVHQPDGIDEGMLHQAMTRHDSGLALLAGPPSMCSPDDDAHHACRTIASLAQDSFSLVFACLTGAHSPESVQLLERSDSLVMTMRLDLISICRAKKQLDRLRDLSVSTGALRVVALETSGAVQLPLKEVTRVLDLEDGIVCIPDDQQAVSMSVNIGAPVVQESPASAVSKAFVELAGTLAERTREAKPPAKAAASQGSVFSLASSMFRGAKTNPGSKK
ncbi:hypothetical protein KOR34_47000 [Posidoniimonas corsicana]|uniref:CobQ/CobB/MinD/ParA nucleotide binding domain protein n=1 Tax=Posidoniimonas corsicana TaxID=1938618 RepID=A0A5C5UYA7_9BACT|nr:hypothetical protein [Posidoniimonas corsicana]TWT31324.1 hypothetical protein KOR34_47000 [Posidoniimonas corsicana]